MAEVRSATAVPDTSPLGSKRSSTAYHKYQHPRHPEDKSAEFTIKIEEEESPQYFGIAATIYNYHEDDVFSLKLPGSIMWGSKEHARFKALEACIAFIDMVEPDNLYTPS